MTIAMAVSIAAFLAVAGTLAMACFNLHTAVLAGTLAADHVVKIGSPIGRNTIRIFQIIGQQPFDEFQTKAANLLFELRRHGNEKDCG